MQFVKATRSSVPMLISISGTSGSGKTYSALLLAAGLAGPKGKVGLIDTENKRGTLYVDSPGIKAALPQGFDILSFDPPFSPARYIEAIDAAEKAGVTVCCLDSTSHEWEGQGGCCDIAENNKLRGMPNWSKAKLEHKKFMNRVLSTNMHIVFCLRARDKVKIVEVNGKTEVVPIGLQAIAEKSFIFEQLLSLQLDEKNHFANPIKVPEPLVGLFTGQHLITKSDGERIREWNETGSAADPLEPIRKRSRGAAELGTKEYEEFYKALTPVQKKHLLDTIHADNKAIAVEADKEALRISQLAPGDPSAANSRIGENAPEFEDFPDAFEYEIGNLIRVKGILYAVNLDKTGWVEFTQ